MPTKEEIAAEAFFYSCARDEIARRITEELGPSAIFGLDDFLDWEGIEDPHRAFLDRISTSVSRPP